MTLLEEMVPVMTRWKLEVRTHSSCSPLAFVTTLTPLANCKVSLSSATMWKLRGEKSVALFQHQMLGGSMRPKYMMPLRSIACAADWFGRSLENTYKEKKNQDSLIRHDHIKLRWIVTV